MFQEFRLLYEADQEVKDDIKEIMEVDLYDGFDINEWRFGRGVASKEDELHRYLKSPLIVLGNRTANDKFDVLQWWRVTKEEYPILSHIAIDLYAIPSMSAEVERAFSGFVYF